jgi:hypothetical protein
MPRGVYLLGLGLALVALALVLTDALLWEPGVTEANVRRVHVGMTLRETQRVLGGPSQVTRRFCDRVQSVEVAVWWGARGEAHVWFADGRVFRVIFAPPARGNPPGPLAHLRAWLGW